MGKDLDNIISLYIENESKTEILKAYECIIKRLTLLAKQGQKLETTIRIEDLDVANGLIDLLKKEGFYTDVNYSQYNGCFINARVSLCDIAHARHLSKENNLTKKKF